MTGPDRRFVPGVVRRSLARFRPDPKPLTVEDRLKRWADRVVEFDVVDRPYVEAVTGRSFGSDADAARFVVTADGGRGLTPSPLIEPEWLQAQLTDPKMSWYDFLHQEDDRLVETGPVFDAAAYVGSLPEAGRPRTTLDALRHFVAHAGPETRLPAPAGRPGDAPTWAEHREASLARARAFAADQVRTRRRYRSTWDGLDAAAARSRYRRGLERATAEQPVVSVVLPTRDRAGSLRAAIASVQAQTWTSWQLVVVDDGSTDGTADLLAQAALDDPRIVPLAQPSLGAGAARNTGLAAATGDVVAFLDSDNAWYPTHLEIALAALLESGASSVFTGLRMRGLNDPAARDGAPVETFRGEDGTWDDLLAGNFIDLNALVVTREAADAVGPFDLRLKRWIDYDYVLRLARAFDVPTHVPHLGVDYDNSHDGGRISSTHPASWQDVAVAPHLIDWPALEASAGDRSPDVVSIVMPVFRDWKLTRRAVEAVLATSDDGPAVEVLLIDNASGRSVSAVLDSWFGGDDRVSVHRQARNLNFGLGSDVGLALSTGSRVVMLNNDTEVQPGWLAPLLAALDDEDVLGAQPLLLYPDGTVQSAGTLFGGDKVMPWHFLAHHPRLDVDRADARRFPAVTAAAAAFRASDLIRWRGFDPVFANGLEDVDLCLRALDERPGSHFAVVLESVVVHHESTSPGRDDARLVNRRLFDERWRGRYPDLDAGCYDDAGLRLVGIEAGEPRGHDVMVRSSRPLVVRAPRSGPWERDGLRWALKADLSDARAVAACARLRGFLVFHGHDVVVDDVAAFYRSSCSIDDVAVLVATAEGAPRFVPQPGAVNAVWFDEDGRVDDLTRASFTILAGPGAGDDHPAVTGRAAVVLDQLRAVAAEASA